METKAKEWLTLDHLNHQTAFLAQAATELAQIVQSARDGRLAGLELKADEAVRIAGECAKLARVVRVLADL